MPQTKTTARMSAGGSTKAAKKRRAPSPERDLSPAREPVNLTVDADGGGSSATVVVKKEPAPTTKGPVASKFSLSTVQYYAPPGLHSFCQGSSYLKGHHQRHNDDIELFMWMAVYRDVMGEDGEANTFLYFGDCKLNLHRRWNKRVDRFTRFSDVDVRVVPITPFDVVNFSDWYPPADPELTVAGSDVVIGHPKQWVKITSRNPYRELELGALIFVLFVGPETVNWKKGYYLCNKC